MGTLSLPRVGLPSEPVDVLDGGDVEPATGRLLTVAELQIALRAARAGTLPDTPAPAARVTRSADATRKANPRARPSAPDRAVSVPAPTASPTAVPAIGVVAAHAGAGASTIALAIADAAAVTGAVQLTEWCDPSRSGLGSVTTSELGTSADGRWRRGARGAVALDRRAALDRPPDWPVPAETVRLHVVDLGQLLGEQPPAGLTLVLVCRASVPGIRHVEQLLTAIDTVAAVAVLGPTRWPGPVAATAGPRIRPLRQAGQLVSVPIDRQLESTGLTSAPLPKSVLAAGRRLLGLIDARYLDGVGSTVRDGAEGTTR